MATIGSFFAEVGFKVNAGQLRTVNSTLKQINTAYKALTSDIKKQGLELKNQLAAEKVSTQASKAKEAQLKAETAEIKKNIAEINLQNKSLKVHNQHLIDVAGSYNRIKRGLKNVFSGITTGTREGFNRLERWTAQTRQTALEYRDFARQTGMSIEGLQKYQAAGENVGSSLTSSQIVQDIKNLQQRAQKIVYGQGDVSPYQMLGIVPNKRDAYEIIEGLRNRIEGLSDSAALMWIRNIGLSDDWLHILRMSSDEFNSIEKTMLSQNQIRKTTQLAMAFRQIQFALKQLKDQMVAFIAQPLANFISNFKMMTLDLAAFLKTMTNSQEAFKIFATGLGLIVLAFAPVTAAIAGLLLLWEDFYVGTHGGKSLFDWGDIDDYNNAIENLKNIAKDIENIWNKVSEIVEGVTKHISGLYKFVKMLGKLAGISDDEDEEKKENNGWSLWEAGKAYFKNLGKTLGIKDKGYTPIGDKGYTPIGDKLYTPAGFTPSGAPVTINDNKTINKTYNVKDSGELIKLENNQNSAPWDEAVYIDPEQWAGANGFSSYAEMVKAQKSMQVEN